MLKVLKDIIVTDEYGVEVVIPFGKYEFSKETWEIKYKGKWFDIVFDELEADGFIKEV